MYHAISNYIILYYNYIQNFTVKDVNNIIIIIDVGIVFNQYRSNDISGSSGFVGTRTILTNKIIMQ